MKVILASGSPRRKELLEKLNIPFEVRVSHAEEIITTTRPEQVTEELSFQKSEAVMRESGLKECIVIAADTVVVLGCHILGKPKDRDEAYEMISALQGKSHYVYTGVTIHKMTPERGDTSVFCERTKVNVAEMNEEEIQSYIDTDEPYDKAGGYGIQGIFSRYIEGIEGDYFNVVGLPLHRVYRELTRMAPEVLSAGLLLQD